MNYKRKILIASNAFIPRMKAQNIVKNNNLNYHYIFNTNEERNRAIKEFNLRKEGTHVADINKKEVGQYGVALAREWGERNLTDINEWYIWLDDNVGHFTWLPYPWYNYDRIDFDIDWSDSDGKELMKKHCMDWRQLYEEICPIEQIIKNWEELINKCEENNTVAGGFAIETNYFFRKIKWQYFGYCRTQNAVIKNTGLPWDYWEGGMIEDMARSLDVIARFGCVCINRFMKPMKNFWEKGGIGSLEERMPNLISGNKKLIEMFPGLVQFVKNREYQLMLKLKTQKSVNKWRKEHGYIK
jgi:hypothetical protein